MPRPYVSRAAIWLALRGRPPTKTSLFDDDPPTASYFYIYLREESGQRRFIVQEMDKGGVGGLWFETERQDGEARALLNSQLAKLRPTFRYHFRGYTYQYESPLRLITALATLHPQRHVIRDKYLQSKFNKIPLVRADRMTVLRVFLEKTLRKSDFSASYVGLMDIMYSRRFVFHPDEEETGAYYEILLESLVTSGDLRRDNAFYRLEPKALATLQNYEEQEQRHRDMDNQQSLLGWLTAALVIVGILQVLATVVGISGIQAALGLTGAQ